MQAAELKNKKCAEVGLEVRAFPKVSNLLSFSSSNPSERQLVTQSPVLCCSRTLNVVPGIHSGSGLLGVPGQGRVQRERCRGGPGALGTIREEPEVPTRSLSTPVSKQMKNVGGWARAKDKKKKPRENET